MDEITKSQLQEALNLAQQNTPESLLKAKEIYVQTLNQEYLEEQKIVEHMQIKTNGYQRLGYVYEKLNDPLEAKKSYLKAVKLNSKLSIIWQRLGLIELNNLKSLKTAEKCFKQSISSKPLLAQKNCAINDSLMYLAEVAFRRDDFRVCNFYLDEIWARVKFSQQKRYEEVLFIYWVKSFLQKFLFDQPTLQDKDYEKEALAFIKTLKQQGLEVQKTSRTSISFIEDFYQTSVKNFKQSQEALWLKGKPLTQVSLQVNQNFPPQALQELLQKLNEEFYDAKDFKEAKEKLMSTTVAFKMRTAQASEEQIQSNYASIFSKEDKELSEDTAAKKKKVPDSEKKLERISSLRSKPSRSTIENVLKSYKFDDVIALKNSLLNSNLSQPEQNFVLSQSEISKAIHYFQTTVQQREEAINSELRSTSPIPDFQRRRKESQSLEDRSKELTFLVNNQLLPFLDNLSEKYNEKGALFILLELVNKGLNHKGFKDLLDAEQATMLYQLFLVLVSGDLSDYKTLEDFFDISTILTIFEMSLFSKNVLKQIKSHVLITHRREISQFLETNDYKIFQMYEKDPELMEPILFRYLYAQMYYSFDISLDMAQASQIFSRIQYFLDEKRNNQVSITLFWIHQNFTIDNKLLQEFGRCKIKEAQSIDSADKELKKLKYEEVAQNKKGNQSQVRLALEYHKLTKFYFDFAFQTLHSVQSQETQAQDLSLNQSPLTQEEENKIKAHWEKFAFCFERQPNIWNSVNQLLASLTAFAGLNTQIYTNYFLQKVDLEKILEVVYDRLMKAQELLLDQMNLNNPSIEDLIKIGLSVAKETFFLDEETSKKNLKFMITKMQMHLMRTFQQDLFHFNLQTKKAPKIVQLIFTSMAILELFSSLCNDQPDPCSFIGVLSTLSSFQSELGEQVKRQTVLAFFNMAHLSLKIYSMELKKPAKGIKSRNFFILETFIENILRHNFDIHLPQQKKQIFQSQKLPLSSGGQLQQVQQQIEKREEVNYDHIFYQLEKIKQQFSLKLADNQELKLTVSQILMERQQGAALQFASLEEQEELDVEELKKVIKPLIQEFTSKKHPEGLREKIHFLITKDPHKFPEDLPTQEYKDIDSLFAIVNGSSQNPQIFSQSLEKFKPAKGFDNISHQQKLEDLNKNLKILESLILHQPYSGELYYLLGLVYHEKFNLRILQLKYNILLSAGADPKFEDEKRCHRKSFNSFMLALQCFLKHQTDMKWWQNIDKTQKMKACFQALTALTLSKMNAIKFRKGYFQLFYHNYKIDYEERIQNYNSAVFLLSSICQKFDRETGPNILQEARAKFLDDMYTLIQNLWFHDHEKKKIAFDFKMLGQSFLKIVDEEIGLPVQPNKQIRGFSHSSTLSFLKFKSLKAYMKLSKNQDPFYLEKLYRELFNCVQLSKYNDSELQKSLIYLKAIRQISKIASNWKQTSQIEKEWFKYIFELFFSEDIQNNELWQKLNQNFMQDSSIPTVSVVRSKIMQKSNSFLPELDSPEQYNTSLYQANDKILNYGGIQMSPFTRSKSTISMFQVLMKELKKQQNYSVREKKIIFIARIIDALRNDLYFMTHLDDANQPINLFAHLFPQLGDKTVIQRMKDYDCSDLLVNQEFNELHLMYKKHKIRNFMIYLCKKASDYETMRTIQKKYYNFSRTSKIRVDEINHIASQVSLAYLETLKTNLMLKYKFLNQVESIATGMNAGNMHPHSDFITWLFMGDKDNKLFKINLNELTYLQLFGMARKCLTVTQGSENVPQPLRQAFEYLVDNFSKKFVRTPPRQEMMHIMIMLLTAISLSSQKLHLDLVQHLNLEDCEPDLEQALKAFVEGSNWFCNLLFHLKAKKDQEMLRKVKIGITEFQTLVMNAVKEEGPKRQQTLKENEHLLDKQCEAVYPSLVVVGQQRVSQPENSAPAQQTAPQQAPQNMNFQQQ